MILLLVLLVAKKITGKNYNVVTFKVVKNYSTRWDEENCQVQCAGCNVFRAGEQYKFSIWLDSNLGSKTSQKLYHKAKQTYKLSNFELLDMINIYENKISEFK